MMSEAKRFQLRDTAELGSSLNVTLAVSELKGLSWRLLVRAAVQIDNYTY